MSLSESMRRFFSTPAWEGGPHWLEERPRDRTPGASVEYILESLTPPRTTYADGSQSLELNTDVVLGLHEDGWRVTTMTARNEWKGWNRLPDVVWGSGLSEVAAQQVVRWALCELDFPADAQEASRRACVAVCGEFAKVEANHLVDALAAALVKPADLREKGDTTAVATERRRAVALVRALMAALGELALGIWEQRDSDVGRTWAKGDVFRAAHVLVNCAPWSGLRKAARQVEAAAQVQGWHHHQGHRTLHWEMDWGDEADLDTYWDEAAQQDRQRAEHVATAG